MTETDTAAFWSRRFGLASAPLFEIGEAEKPGAHHVLLDGGQGTFALSVSEEELWRTARPAEWIWSSDIPHHVTMTENVVAVLRWDKLGEPQVFRRPSVERDLDGFYAYLANDRVRSNKTVVEHLLGFFRRLRSLAHAEKIPDEATTEIFTAALANLIAPNDEPATPSRYGLSDDALDLLARLDSRGRAAAEDEIKRASGSLALLRLHPALAIRHAGGQLFQEAHFELLRVPASPDLWGLLDAPLVKPANRGYTHYTPPALARSVVEQALHAIENIKDRAKLTVCDPACGSGAFLHETLRAVRRLRIPTKPPGYTERIPRTVPI
jgi:adenine-specific DNA-methyltransferase